MKHAVLGSALVASSIVLAGCGSAETLCTTEIVPSEITGDLPLSDPPSTVEGTHATFCWRNECSDMKPNDPARKVGNYALVQGAIRVGYMREGFVDFKDGDPVHFTLYVDAPAPGAKARYEVGGSVDGVAVSDDGCRRYARGRIVPR